MAELLEQINAQMDDNCRLCQNLDRAVLPDWLNEADLVLAQEKYNQLAALRARFSSYMQEFNDSLPLDEAGDPIIPVNGELGYLWREEEYNAVLGTIDGSPDRASLAMVQYKKLCTMVVAARIQNEATCSFLQGSPWEELLIRAIQSQGGACGGWCRWR